LLAEPGLRVEIRHQALRHNFDVVVLIQPTGGNLHLLFVLSKRCSLRTYWRVKQTFLRTYQALSPP
jgi:hypothetical protein